MPKEITLNQSQIEQMYVAERAKIEALERQKATLGGMLADTETAIRALDSVSKAKGNEKIMVSLGAGVFIDATIADNKSASGSFHGGVLMRLSADEARAELEKKRDALREEMQTAVREEERIVININNLAKVIAAGQRVLREARMKKAQGGQTAEAPQ